MLKLIGQSIHDFLNLRFLDYTIHKFYVFVIATFFLNHVLLIMVTGICQHYAVQANYFFDMRLNDTPGV